MESNLTAPWDKIPGSTKASVISRSLTDEEATIAFQEKIDNTYVQKFPQSDRFYADPIYQNQVYCLISFIPSKGAKPDDQGVFGFMKFRGTFHNPEEANERAEWIVRNVDSYHAIQTAYVGRPFPICADTRKYVAETRTVDIRSKAVKTISEDIKQKKLDEKKELDDIKEREKRLLEETKEDYVEDPLEKYTTLQVKKANLLHMYVSTRKRLDGMKDNIRSTFKEIATMDAESSEYKQHYRSKYDEARKAVNLPTTGENVEDNFLRFLGDDYLDELDFDPSI